MSCPPERAATAMAAGLVAGTDLAESEMAMVAAARVAVTFAKEVAA